MVKRAGLLYLLKRTCCSRAKRNRRVIWLSWKDWRLRPGGRFICIDLDLLAVRLGCQFDPARLCNIVAVGSSGTGFARRFAPACPTLPIETTAFNRQRELRQLLAEPLAFDGEPILVDDLAVSGLTLAVANRALQPAAQTAGVGMLYGSKTTMRMIGLDDIRYGLMYVRQQGGRPPVNSLDSLRAFPDRCQVLAERYFSAQQAAFCDLIANPGVVNG